MSSALFDLFERRISNSLRLVSGGLCKDVDARDERGHGDLGLVAQSVYRSLEPLTGGSAGPWGRPELF